MITRQRLQDWMAKHRVELTPEAIGEVLALASTPQPAPPTRHGPTSAIRVTPGATEAAFRDRVTEAQARVFAGYCEDEIETVWYRAMPTSPWEGEFEALRDLAADLLDARLVSMSLLPLIPLFRAAVRYRDCWTPNAVMSVNQAARELVDAVREVEELIKVGREALIKTDRDVHGDRPPD